MADKMTEKFGINWRLVLMSMVGSMIGFYVGRCSAEHRNDESGTVLSKSNYEITIDLDGDKKADRMIKFYQYGIENNDVYYNYVQPGDKISYSNTWQADTLRGVGSSYNKIYKINDAKAKDIKKWYEMTQHANGR